ncbi:MAG: hypothetical protein DMF61_09470 [Blastocatellia bacterium AA13]|nr:MAG: hypothetical protein DMF61_09470 [Blastocatellia bacterium AA13]
MKQTPIILYQDISSIHGDTPIAQEASQNERVAASVENWKRKLLDLTKRNRALNFKMNKISTIMDHAPLMAPRRLKPTWACREFELNDDSN